MWEEKSDGTSSSIIFPRYVSQDQQTLKFDIVDKKPIYASNPNYILGEQQHKGLLGGIEEYLLLTHKKEGNQKILVPFRSIVNFKPFSSKQQLDIYNENSKKPEINKKSDIQVNDIDNPNSRDLYIEQNKRFTFIEYDIKQGIVTPLTQEGVIYLAYLYLSQRRYVESARLLKQLDFRIDLSSDSKRCLEKIIKFQKEEKDFSPEASAIAMRAWVLGARTAYRIRQEGRRTWHTKAVKASQENYFRHQHAISEELLLSHEEFTYLKNKNSKEWNYTSHPDIAKYVPSQDRKIESVSEPELPYPTLGFSTRLSYSYSYSGYHNENSIHNQNVQHNQYKVRNETDFLPPVNAKSPSFSLYDKPFLLTELWQTDFLGKFFPRAYNIAKKGTELEKKQLEFRLQLVGDQYSKKDLPLAWNYLQFALQYPSLAPDLPKDYDSFSQRWNFVTELKRAINARRDRNIVSEDVPHTISSYSEEKPCKALVEPILPTKKVEAKESPLTLVSFSKENIDAGFTASLYTKHFEAIEPESMKSVTLNEKGDKSWLKDDEKAFETVLETVYKEFVDDYKKGKEINSNRKFYTLHDESSLKNKLGNEIKHLKSELVNLEAMLLELANRQDPDNKRAQLFKEMKVHNELTLKNLAHLFLRGDKAAFAKSNPFLRDESLVNKIAEAYNIPPHPDLAIEYLYNTMGLYMTLHVQMTRLSRAEQLCGKIEKIETECEKLQEAYSQLEKDTSSTDKEEKLKKVQEFTKEIERGNLKKEAIIQELALELTPPNTPFYSIQEHPEFLAFEYLSGLSMREDQARLLSLLLKEDENGSYINRVIQLIMGGGKTAVIAVVILMLAAKKDRLSIFVTPASQYTSVSHNLRKIMRECFDKDMEEIDISREQMTSDMCLTIEKRLKAAIDRGDFLLMKAETLQGLELEFLDLVYKVSEQDTASPDIMNKINTLRRILLIFREQGDALFDEVDLLLNVLQEVNFPLGDPEHVSPERIELLREMFTLFVNQNVKFYEKTTVNLKKITGSDQHTLLPRDQWQEIAMQSLWNFACDEENLKLKYHFDFHESFYRYIQGNIKKICQKILNSPDDPKYSDWKNALTLEDRKDLEFLQYVKFLKESSDPSEKEAACQIALIKHINEQSNTLLKLLPLYFEQGNALFNNKELLLKILTEENFILDQISSESIDLFKKICALFVSDSVEIREKKMVDLKQLIGLIENRQSFLPKEKWDGVVAECVAQNLACNIDSLKLKYHRNLHESFYRYISGKMKEVCQKMLDSPNDSKYLEWENQLTTEKDKQDLEFVCYVNQLSQSSDKEEREAAHQIALVKHMMEKVLPVTFEKTGKRHYGRGGSKPGEVRPFLAVDTPSKNLFGYHWEAIAYHFQTALQCGISELQLSEIAKIYRKQAEVRSENEKIPFDETIEAVEFKELTGVSLHEMEDPVRIKEAKLNLHNPQNIEALLKFEADSAAEYVTFHPFRLSSTGQALVKMFATVRSMSGTPWQTPCFDKSLAENFIPALGTEGQIADLCLSRIALKEKKYVHTVESETLPELLKELLEKHPDKQRVRMIMDSGALFKDFSNIDVAKALRDHLNMPILFFMRDPKQEEISDENEDKGKITPDTLALLKVGSDTPVIIGGTRLDDIEKKGIGVEEYFVFADERHTTGTDVPLIPETIGLMTLDEKMLRRSFFQTILRLRGFFVHQDVEFVIPKRILTELLPSGFEGDLGHVLGGLLTSVKNQAIALSKDYFRSCKQKIDTVMKEGLLDKTEGLLCKEELTHEAIKKRFEPFKNAILIAQGDSPYEAAGALEYDIDSIKALEAYRNRKLASLKKSKKVSETEEILLLSENQVTFLEQETQKIIEDAKKSPYIPKTVKEAGSQDLGMQVDVLTELVNEVNQSVQTNVEEELLRELQSYQSCYWSNLREEDQWDDHSISSFLEDLLENKEFVTKDKKTIPSLFNKKTASLSKTGRKSRATKKRGDSSIN